MFADAITTVSPTYAKEILAEPGGNGLASYLQKRSADFEGVLNGADYEVWNPGDRSAHSGHLSGAFADRQGAVQGGTAGRRWAWRRMPACRCSASWPG